MEELLLYHLNVAFIMSVLAVIYSFLFSREKYFHINRLYLIFAVIISFVLPLLSFQSTIDNPINIAQFEQSAQEIIIYSSSNISDSGSNMPYLLILYWVGAAFFAILFALRLFNVILHIYRQHYIKKDGYYVSYDENSENSFTFFNRINIGLKGISNEEANIIEQHEKIHVEKKHTIDIIFYEFVKIFQWFNPAIYFLKKFITVNHEYTADDTIKRKFSKRHYMELIAKSIKGAPLYPVNSFFNKSILRKRFEMLTSEKHKKGIYKYLYVVPLVGLLFIFISCETENEAFEDALSIQEIIDDAKNIGTDNIGAQFPGGTYEYFEKNLNVPAGAENVNAKLHYNVVIDESGKLIAFEYKNSKFINKSDKFEYLNEFKKIAEDKLVNMPKWNPAKKDGKPVKFRKYVGIIFGGKENWKNLNPPDYTIKSDNGNEIMTERNEKDLPEVEHLYYNDLMMHITNNIHYPEKAQKESMEAKVILNVEITKKGEIKNTSLSKIIYTQNNKVVNPEGKDPYGFVEEAIKVVKSVKELPAAKDKEGNHVAVAINLPITFKLGTK